MTSGCLEQQSITPTSVAAPTPLAQASYLLSAGKYVEAADALAKLAARPNPLNGTDLKLRAGLIYADLGDLPRAFALFPPPSQHPASMREALAVSIAQHHAGRKAEAISTLDAVDSTSFEPFEKGLFLRTLGRVQIEEGDQAGLVNLINAEIFPLPGKRRTGLTHLIWDALRDSQDPMLETKLNPRNPALTGWLALLAETRATGNGGDDLAARLAGWRIRFPTHPANEMLLDEIIEAADQQETPIARVAFLLPLEGELASYAEAIRDGFMAMRFGNNDQALRVRFYSARGHATPAMYAQAIKDGAQLVVGPLDKPGIDAIAKLDTHPVPLLTLNKTTLVPSGKTNGSLPVFTQFALSPEDEGEDLARRAWRDGHRRMAALVPKSDLGGRIHRAFADTWHQLGGTLVETSGYENSVPAYKDAIRKIFSLSESEARAARLRQLLARPLVFLAIPRPDLDGVMLVADPVAGRQIIPQFRYLGVDQLPIYATSLIFAEEPNASADQDLNDVIFGTMPWNLDTRDQPLRAMLSHHWPKFDATQRRLFAFGIDAYRLVKALPKMARTPTLTIEGATGALQRDSAGRIKRRLSWAIFHAGSPQLL